MLVFTCLEWGMQLSQLSITKVSTTIPVAGALLFYHDSNVSKIKGWQFSSHIAIQRSTAQVLQNELAFMRWKCDSQRKSPSSKKFNPGWKVGIDEDLIHSFWSSPERAQDQHFPIIFHHVLNQNLGTPLQMDDLWTISSSIAIQIHFNLMFQ